MCYAFHMRTLFFAILELCDATLFFLIDAFLYLIRPRPRRRRRNRV